MALQQHCYELDRQVVELKEENKRLKEQTLEFREEHKNELGVPTRMPSAPTASQMKKPNKSVAKNGTAKANAVFALYNKMCKEALERGLVTQDSIDNFTENELATCIGETKKKVRACYRKIEISRRWYNRRRGYGEQRNPRKLKTHLKLVHGELRKLLKVGEDK